jgi:hypothetical protein
MSQSLRSVRLLVAVAAVTASSACMGDPFAPGNDGEVVVVHKGTKGAKPIANSCRDSTNSENSQTARCPFRH